MFVRVDNNIIARFFGSRRNLILAHGNPNSQIRIDLGYGLETYSSSDEGQIRKYLSVDRMLRCASKGNSRTRFRELEPALV